MQLNSDEAIAQARRDFRRYGSNWFNVFAAATRWEDGVLVLPPEAPADVSVNGAGGHASSQLVGQGRPSPHR